MRDTTARGDLTEWKIVAALVEDGRKLLRPTSSASRYDLVIDNEDGTFTRVQCKTGKLRNGRVEFRLYSMSGHRGTTGRTYVGEIDAFAIYCPDNRETYFVPMAELAGRKGVACLRVAPCRNGQVKRTRAAGDYRVGGAVRTKLIPS